MDTPGNSSNQIEFVADVSGEQTGDAGLVIISAYNNESSTASRAGCFNLNGQEFVTIRGFSLVGGTTACIYANASGAQTYEGVIIEDCGVVGGHDQANDRGIYIDYNAGASPTTTGLTVRRCIFRFN